MDAATIKKLTQASTTLLLEGLGKNDIKIITESMRTFIPKEIIEKLLESVEPGSSQYKLLMSVTIVSQILNTNEKYIALFKKHIGSEFLKTTDIDTKIQSAYDTSEFTKRTNEFCDMLWPTGNNICIEHLKLLLINYFSSFRKMGRHQPFINANTMTPKKFVDSIYEMIHIFFLLLKDFNTRTKSGIEIDFVDNINWIMDNSSDPIEKRIICFLKTKTHPEITTARVNGDHIVKMKIEHLHNFIREAYDLEKMIDDIFADHSASEIIGHVTYFCGQFNIILDVQYACALLICNSFMIGSTYSYVKTPDLVKV